MFSSQISFRCLDTVYTDIYVQPWIQKQHFDLIQQEHKLNPNILWNESKLSLYKNNFENAKYDSKSFSYSKNSIRVGTIQMYGKTMGNQSVRCDTIFCPYFYIRLPLCFSRDHCFQTWNTIKSVKQQSKSYKSSDSSFTTLDRLVYFVEFARLENGQQFNLGRKHNHLQLYFITQTDMKHARSVLRQFKMNEQIIDQNQTNQTNQADRILKTRNLNLIDPPADIPEEIKILLFETQIKPIYLWNRHYYNLNGWLTIQNKTIIW